MQRLTEKHFRPTHSIKSMKDDVLLEIYDKLKLYEDLEEHGLLLRLPCKVGDTVYEVQELRGHIQLYEVTSISISKNNILFWWEIKDGGIYSNTTGFTVYAIGKTVFLTKEEAEKKLREMEAGECG